jgi:hypothetical protein
MICHCELTFNNSVHVYFDSFVTEYAALRPEVTDLFIRRINDSCPD